MLLLREVRMEQPFIYRTGSKEAGQKWTDIAANLNKHPDFQMSRDQRSVRERFNKLLQDFTSKINKEENASGISPVPLTEAKHIQEEIKEVIASNVLAPKTNDKAEGERNKALKIRNQAMKTWGKESQKDDEEVEEKPRRKRNKRSTVGPLEYLASKRDSEMELRKEELQLRKQQLELESKRQAQMQEQMLFQQRQMQQQMQLMLALVQENKKQ